MSFFSHNTIHPGGENDPMPWRWADENLSIRLDGTAYCDIGVYGNPNEIMHFCQRIMAAVTEAMLELPVAAPADEEVAS
jgi:hypothetical protein